MPRRRPSPCPRGRAPCRAARRRAQGLWARQSLSSPLAATGAPIRRHRRTTGSTRRVCTRRSPQHICIARASPPRTLGDSQEDPLSSSGTGSPAWPTLHALGRQSVSLLRACLADFLPYDQTIPHAPSRRSTVSNPCPAPRPASTAARARTTPFGRRRSVPYGLGSVD